LSYAQWAPEPVAGLRNSGMPAPTLPCRVQ
jgi:hypothetical protein